MRFFKKKRTDCFGLGPRGEVVSCGGEFGTPINIIVALRNDRTESEESSAQVERRQHRSGSRKLQQQKLVPNKYRVSGETGVKSESVSSGNGGMAEAVLSPGGTFTA